MRFTLIVLGLFLAVANVGAADSDHPAVSAKELAARLAAIQNGTSNVRLKMEVQSAGGSAKSELQLQIKQRRSGTTTDILYQVLWPKERQNEAVLLHMTAGHAASGFVASPPNKPHTLSPSQMSESLFGSDLSYEDAVEDFFAWEDQKLVGTETVDRAECVILESKPGDGDHSTYARVRSWIDTKRLVPLRVEKYLASGRAARRIDTTRIVNDDKGRPIPANLTVSGARADSTTELDGSRIRHDVTYTDQDFTPESLVELTSPHPAAQ